MLHIGMGPIETLSHERNWKVVLGERIRKSEIVVGEITGNHGWA
jgi:hypothetical protein